MGAPAMASKYALYSQVLFQRASAKGKKPIPLCRVNEALFQNAKTVRAGQRITQDDELVVIAVFQPAQIIADRRILPGGDIFLPISASTSLTGKECVRQTLATSSHPFDMA